MVAEYGEKTKSGNDLLKKSLSLFVVAACSASLSVFSDQRSSSLRGGLDGKGDRSLHSG
jgi:hypothetical protein